MYVKFEFTEEDLIDASKRFLNRGNLGRSGAWESSLYSAISAAVIIVFLLRNNLRTGLLLGLVAAGIIFLLYTHLQKSRLESQLRRVVAEMMPDPGPHVCEVEIRSKGVWLRQMNKQIIYEWKSLEAIEETSDSVDIFSRDGGGVVVRNRAFGSEGERQQFIELAKARLMESRS